MSSSFISKIKYKKTRLGVVEKDGKTYVKYVKESRFRISKTVKYVLLSAFILIILWFAIMLLMSEFASRGPAAETSAELEV